MGTLVEGVDYIEPLGMTVGQTFVPKLRIWSMVGVSKT